MKQSTPGSYHPKSNVAPGLLAGRGLKLPPARLARGRSAVAPGLPVGRGLKLLHSGASHRIGRVAPGLPVGRGLKHCVHPIRAALDARRARPSGRAWVETQGSQHHPARDLVAPGLPLGRGLKHIETEAREGDGDVAPGLPVGRGLKHCSTCASLLPVKRRARPSGRAWVETVPLLHNPPFWAVVAPGLPVGRGLKLRLRQPRFEGDASRPAFRSGVG